MAAHVALITAPMVREHFYNADGEMLVVAQQGRLRSAPNSASSRSSRAKSCVIPRGVMFRAEPVDGAARAYVCENYGGGLHAARPRADRRELFGQPARLPNPVASYEDVDAPHTADREMGRRALQYAGRTFADRRRRVARQLLPVINTNLRRFSPVGAISFDHPDPSIFTVMTSPSRRPARPTSTS